MSNPSIPSSTLHQESMASELRELIEFDTSPDGHDYHAAADWLRSRLEHMSFAVDVSESAGPPLLVATRDATGDAEGHVCLFGHYDVDHVEPGWDTLPFELVQQDGRYYGLGIADNKGSLATRLAVIRAVKACPRLTWVIQGEEESGSRALKTWIESYGLPSADWFLDENGWANANGSQCVLGCQVASGGHVPLAEKEAKALLEVLSGGWNKRHIEPRVLNKHLVPGGCAFQAALPEGSRYLGIGTNDAQTKIHAPNESIPVSGIERHFRGLGAFLDAVARGGM